MSSSVISAAPAARTALERRKMITPRFRQQLDQRAAAAGFVDFVDAVENENCTTAIHDHQLKRHVAIERELRTIDGVTGTVELYHGQLRPAGWLQAEPAAAVA